VVSAVVDAAIRAGLPLFDWINDALEREFEIVGVLGRASLRSFALTSNRIIRRIIVCSVQGFSDAVMSIISGDSR
jgi:hypothetical protein